MEILTISGGSGLFGEVRIPGAKNSVLPIMAASVLCRGTVTLTDVPHLSDVEASARILQSVGCKVLLENGRAVITPPEFPGSAVPEPLMRAMRSSLFYLAPLLARTGRADIYTPGGCRLGAGVVPAAVGGQGLYRHGGDVGLEKMGAHITEKDGGALEVTAPDGLAGADICLRFPSVGATETLLMAAAAARGETVLRGAAVEPEVTDLVRFLQGAGADITGVGTRVLHIRGRELLMGTQHAVCPDRITAATVLCAVAGCGGEVLLTNTCNAHLAEVLRILRRAGCMVSVSGDSSVALASSGALRAAGGWDTGVYPSFPTDAAPLMAAALLRAQGESRVTDTIFENRFACAEGFLRLGASVNVCGRTLHVHGMDLLNGADVEAPDLRGGAALVIAALQAQGSTRVMGAEHISRGYEDIAALLAPLGARITRSWGEPCGRGCRNAGTVL